MLARFDILDLDFRDSIETFDALGPGSLPLTGCSCSGSCDCNGSDAREPESASAVGGLSLVNATPMGGTGSGSS